MGDLLTVREAADRLGRSHGFVRALIADGSVDGRKHGNGRWYLSRRSLDAWLAGWSVNPQPDPVAEPPMLWSGRARR